MTKFPAAIPFWRCLRSGAIAGALSSVSFALIHALFISNIWFSVAPMLVAGAVCGLCLAGSYAVVARPSLASWVGYNALFIAMLALLGLTSVLVFEPVTTIAALLQTHGPPDQLFRQALPLTAIFTLASALVLSLFYRRGWRGFAAILVSSAVLVLLLGLNVSVNGLVAIPRSSLYLVLELFGLVLTLGLVYTALFAALERKSLSYRTND